MGACRKVRTAGDWEKWEAVGTSRDQQTTGAGAAAAGFWSQLWSLKKIFDFASLLDFKDLKT